MAHPSMDWACRHKGAVGIAEKKLNPRPQYTPTSTIPWSRCREEQGHIGHYRAVAVSRAISRRSLWGVRSSFVVSELKIGAAPVFPGGQAFLHISAA